MKGYRVHLNRVNLAKGKITRTIKYPLISPPSLSPDSLVNFFEKIVFDDQKTRGIGSVADYLQTQDEYNLFDFWVDSLRSGVIFQPTRKKLIHFLCQVFDIPSPAEVIFTQADERIRTFFDKGKFIEQVILSDPVRITLSREKFRQRLIDILKDDYKTNQDPGKKVEKMIITDQKAKELIDTIVDKFFKDGEKLVLEGKDQLKFWKDEFNLNFQRISPESQEKDIQPQEKVGDLTNFIIPTLVKLDDRSKVPIEELINDRINLLRKIFSLPEKEILIQGEVVLGLAEDFNSLSNYLGRFYRSLIEDYQANFEAYLRLCSFIDKKLNSQEEEILMKALDYLADKAKKIGQPKFVTQGWQEYRMVFGGKIKSWYSNFVNRTLESREVYQKFLQNLEKLISSLSKHQDKIKKGIDEKKKLHIRLLKTFIDWLLNLQKLLQDNPDILESPKKFPFFEDYLAEVRTQANYYFQRYLKKNEDDSVSKDRQFKFLFEQIKKPIDFYGESKRAQLEERVKLTPKKINEGMKIIRQILDKYNGLTELKSFDSLEEEVREISLEEIVERFFRKISNQVLNTQVFKNQYQKILTPFIDQRENISEIFSHPEKYIFFKNPHASSTRRLLSLSTNMDPFESIKLILNQFSNFLIDLSSRNKDFYFDPKLALDFVETSKTVLALLINFNSQSNLDLDPKILHQLKVFDRVLDFLSLHHKGNEGSRVILEKKVLNSLFNRYFLSDLRGALNLYSKKIEISRYTLQIINSNKRFPLILHLPDPMSQEEFNKKRKEVVSSRHQFFVVFDESFAKRELSSKEKTKTFLIDKNEIKPIEITRLRDNLNFKISSSFYQTQFLDRLIYRPKSWEQAEIEINGPSIILEIAHEINFDLETETVTTNSSHLRKKLYYAIPFTITGKRTTTLYSSNLYLGIDAGEYGVAFALVDFSRNPFEIIKAEYLKSSNIRKIRDAYEKIQRRSRHGIFITITSLLQKIRENAIKEIRNQIHDLFIKYKSPIVYEYSISNFETGSGRVTKIYDSIKRSDVPGDNDADRATIKHVWGLKSFKNLTVGKNLSAFASSYTCCACGRSLYRITNYLQEKSVSICERINKNGIKNIIRIKTPEGILLGYTSNKNHTAGYLFKKSESDEKEFLKVVRRFARPPLEKSEVLLAFLRLNSKKLKKIKKTRGNSAIFVCPFEDCLKIFDADLQAAFVMALRGYLRDKNPLQSENINLFEETLAYLSHLRKSGVNLSLKKLTPEDLIS